VKKHGYFQLAREDVKKLVEKYGSPLMVLSLQQIEANYKRLRRYLPRAQVHYAIKANPYPEILRSMIKMGSSFDVASDGEIRLLSSMGVKGEQMIYANPVKTLGGLKACRECGVSRMTFDSKSELEKIASVMPGATVLLRLRIDNSSAHVDLNKKFGAGRDQAIDLMKYAKTLGLDIAGIAFHVGSQTTIADPYLKAMDVTRELFEETKKIGIQLRVLDIGGGFPIPETHGHFNLSEMLKQINARLEEDFANVEIWCEPGRYICGTAVNLITSVIGVTERGGQPWYFLDEGLYGSFSGVIFDQWDFRLLAMKDSKEEEIEATFAGPSCDSLDIMFRGCMTVPLKIGDILLVPACGAYTSASATNFNGFSTAKYVVWEQIK